MFVLNVNLFGNVTVSILEGPFKLSFFILHLNTVVKTIFLNIQIHLLNFSLFNNERKVYRPTGLKEQNLFFDNGFESSH